MYYYISGEKVLLEPGTAVIDNNGIAYRITVSDRTLGRLAADGGETVRLYIHEYVREDAHELFGFYETEERRTFALLIGVSGVGPRAAMSVLSALSPERFALCVISEDAKAITCAQGIGLKTAQKIILELKDKIAKEQGRGISGKAAPGTRPEGRNDRAEAVDALMVLGYSKADAVNALHFEGSDGLRLEELIRSGLKRLTRSKP